MTLGCLLAALSFASCSKDDGDPQTDEATIDLFAGLSKGTGNAFEVQEDEIGSLRLLIFEHYSGNYSDNIEISSYNSEEPISINLKTGRYDFVFVANETVDANIAAQLDAVSSGTNISQLQEWYFSSASINNSGVIPLARVIRDIQVLADNHMVLHKPDGGQEIVSGKWRVNLERLAVKVNLTVATYQETIKDDFKELRVVNVPAKVFLMKERLDGTVNDNSGVVETDEIFIGASRTFVRANGDAYYAEKSAGYRIIPLETPADWVQTDQSGDLRYEWYKRLILPALEFPASGNDAQDKARAITFQVKSASGANDRTGYMPSPTNYSVLRNNIYVLTGLLDNNQIEFAAGGISVADWETGSGGSHHEDIE